MIRRVLLAVLGALALMAVTAGIASADNCDINLNPDDCKNTGWVVGGTAAATAAAAAGAAVASSGSKKSAAECADNVAKFRTAQAAWRVAKQDLDTALQAAKVSSVAEVETRVARVAKIASDLRNDLARGEGEYAQAVAELDGMQGRLWVSITLGAVAAYLAWGAALAVKTAIAASSAFKGAVLGAAMHMELAAQWGWATMMSAASILGYTQSNAARISMLLAGARSLLASAYSHLSAAASTLISAAVGATAVIASPLESYNRALESVISSHRQALDLQAATADKIGGSLTRLRKLLENLRKKQEKERELREEAKAAKSALAGCEGMEHILAEEPN